MVFSNTEANILWFPCLKKRLSENPFYSAINLKGHTVEALTYPIQCKVISTHTDGIKKETPPPCLKCTALFRPKSQQSPLTVVVF